MKHLEILVLATTKQMDILNLSMQQPTYSDKIQLCDQMKKIEGWQCQRYKALDSSQIIKIMKATKHQTLD